MKIIQGKLSNKVVNEIIVTQIVCSLSIKIRNFRGMVLIYQ